MWKKKIFVYGSIAKILTFLQKDKTMRILI